MNQDFIFIDGDEPVAPHGRHMPKRSPTYMAAHRRILEAAIACAVRVFRES
jgi:hypothetical protein